MENSKTMTVDAGVLKTEDGLLPRQVVATPAAEKLILELVEEQGPLMFYQSGGCCEGSAPLCFHRGEFLVGDRDVLLGELYGQPFYISGPQFEYWKHTRLIVDAMPGMGEAFSLEGTKQMCFLLRSQVFSDAEIAELRRAGRI